MYIFNNINNMNKNMNLDEEMKLWEIRDNDEFGKTLRAIRELTNDYFCIEKDEFGIESTPISHYCAIYSLDGEKARKSIAESVHDILYDYDILGNDEGVNSLVNELNRIANL